MSTINGLSAARYATEDRLGLRSSGMDVSTSGNSPRLVSERNMAMTGVTPLPAVRNMASALPDGDETAPSRAVRRQ
jgi:hypothetical protein